MSPFHFFRPLRILLRISALAPGDGDHPMRARSMIQGHRVRAKPKGRSFRASRACCNPRWTLLDGVCLLGAHLPFQETQDSEFGGRLSPYFFSRDMQLRGPMELGRLNKTTSCAEAFQRLVPSSIVGPAKINRKQDRNPARSLAEVVGGVVGCDEAGRGRGMCRNPRSSALKRGNGGTAPVCGHYGTTAIIRDFPFAPYLFLVPRARTQTHAGNSQLSPSRSLRAEANRLGVSGRGTKPATDGWLFSRTRACTQPRDDRKRGGKSQEERAGGGNGGGYNRGLMKPVEVRQTGSAGSPFATSTGSPRPSVPGRSRTRDPRGNRRNRDIDPSLSLSSSLGGLPLADLSFSVQQPGSLTP